MRVSGLAASISGLGFGFRDRHEIREAIAGSG